MGKYSPLDFFFPFFGGGIGRFSPTILPESENSVKCVQQEEHRRNFDPITIKSGVKQGCRLSGLLFHLAIDPIIKSLQGSFDQHKVLTFADDLCLLAKSSSELKDLLNLLKNQMDRLGLLLNRTKSYSYHLQCCILVGLQNTPF
ncbi:reverse transcriptase domain-containing protein [Caerostris extrusa]|uniref:Reverse transcriptase domain-containing protein n=1 Tax=Caerostris extrusa TaxID=172846 RepID=A0AAV4TJK6_CAEEX|nr:reverse transcriptase domain-containing protein [Caerostris extrusa]